MSLSDIPYYQILTSKFYGPKLAKVMNYQQSGTFFEEGERYVVKGVDSLPLLLYCIIISGVS